MRFEYLYLALEDDIERVAVVAFMDNHLVLEKLGRFGHTTELMVRIIILLEEVLDHLELLKVLDQDVSLLLRSIFLIQFECFLYNVDVIRVFIHLKVGEPVFRLITTLPGLSA